MCSSRAMPQAIPSRAESCDAAGIGEKCSRLPTLGAFLDADPRPSFIVPVSETSPLPFELLACNISFRQAGLEGAVLRDVRDATLFRAWTQAIVHWREEHEFAGRSWTAFRIQDQWKCVQASGKAEGAAASVSPRTLGRSSDFTSSTIKALEEVKITDTKLASFYKMMEMSDVGTFEYDLHGTLLLANESWYRMCLHPKADGAYTDLSFMDLVYPPDGPLVLSQWNKLVQGLPVTFEMRWKGKNYQSLAEGGDNADYQWVLSACVPIMDNEGNLISIAGNTIDINAQKQVQEEALQRAEALERARRSERKFARFALLAPIAIYICDARGRMTYCNRRFFELTGYPYTDDPREIDWDYVCHEDDKEAMRRQRKRLLNDKQRISTHFRVRHTWDLGDGTLRQAWMESQAFPEVDDEGNIVSVFGTITDISRFKWAEEIQKSRMQEALDAKHKHENFIDMTSHEMRNPLSAVIQCADSTIDSLKLVSTLTSNLAHDGAYAEQISSEIRMCVDSLNTIISCSIHQKRVIDDVLTLSKMDSNLLTIAPVRVEPAAIVSEAVHMFELECHKDKIELSFVEDPSLMDNGSQYVMMDPSRVLQVLINLLTNAIKFTRDRPDRRIEVSLGASLSRPPDGFRGLPYATVATDSQGLLDGEEWGAGREVYIWIQCCDTGCGMSAAEQSNLFTRFSQATPRTHIRYGGSGLGLFISKKLAELQGGAIGVISEPDVGSTFSFFVATRTAPPPTPAPRFDAIKEWPLSRVVSREAQVAMEGTRIAMEGSMEQAPEYSVLIVEDNLVNQKVLSQQLRKAGCQVHVANHGEEALDFLRNTEYWAATSTSSSPPSQPQPSLLPTPPPSSEKTPQLSSPPIKLSVILMDIEMPVMDGLACTRKIRELQGLGQIVRHIPIMAVSANARSEQVAQAREAGMDDAISKPFRIPELMPKIGALVNGEGPVLVLPSSQNLA
ncbi:hypothetical protein SUNI508_05881 [Seiridium unicorne]|uniref:LOV domain-containing protein n=1 Tax=Seiridium unicorne TaxID=138068 RepID=A0ABR2V364_9PEZI